MICPRRLAAHFRPQLDHGTFRLSAQTDLRLVLPQRIDWSVFDRAGMNLSSFLLRVLYTSHCRYNPLWNSCLSSRSEEEWPFQDPTITVVRTAIAGKDSEKRNSRSSLRKNREEHYGSSSRLGGRRRGY